MYLNFLEKILSNKANKEISLTINGGLLNFMKQRNRRVWFKLTILKPFTESFIHFWLFRFLYSEVIIGFLKIQKISSFAKFKSAFQKVHCLSLGNKKLKFDRNSVLLTSVSNYCCKLEILPDYIYNDVIQTETNRL